jgi:hypothetical protein
MVRTLATPRLVLLFCVLSALDVTFTCLLLSGGQGQVIEANPIARFWLEAFGVVGLAGFKVMVVLCVIGLCYIIGRYRPAASVGIYMLGCCLLTLVVAYSFGRVVRMYLAS